MVFLLATIAGEIVLNNAVKGVVDRPRPAFSQIVTPTGQFVPQWTLGRRRGRVRRDRDRVVARPIAFGPAGMASGR